MPATTPRQLFFINKPQILGLTFLVCGAGFLHAAPIMDQPAADHRPHVTVTLLGFAKHGRVAFLEEQSPAGNENTATSRQLTVFNLATDKVLFHAEAEVDVSTSEGGRRFDEQLQQTLRDQDILPVDDAVLEKFPAHLGGDTYALIIGPATPLPAGTFSRLEDGFESSEGCAEYTLTLQSEQKGSKEIGRMRSVPSSTGLNPVSAPVLLGYLRDPYEDRIVIVLGQDLGGAEGWTTPLFRFVGARLDRRFKQR